MCFRPMDGQRGTMATCGPSASHKRLVQPPRARQAGCRTSSVQGATCSCTKHLRRKTRSDLLRRIAIFRRSRPQRRSAARTHHRVPTKVLKKLLLIRLRRPHPSTRCSVGLIDQLANFIMPCKNKRLCLGLVRRLHGLTRLGAQNTIQVHKTTRGKSPIA